MTAADYKSAVELPPAERLELISILWTSLDEGELKQDHDDAELQEVLASRLKDFSKDPSCGVPIEDFFRVAREKLG